MLAAFILLLETVLCLSLLGPQPLGWLWVGSQVQYLTGAVTAGISMIMLGCLASLMLTMVVAKRLDHWWKLVRRAAGYQQDRGAIESIFAICVLRHADRVHLLVLHHPGPRPDDRPQQLMGLLDCYRQFEDVDPGGGPTGSAATGASASARWSSSASPTWTCRGPSGPSSPTPRWSTRRSTPPAGA